MADALSGQCSKKPQERQGESLAFFFCAGSSRPILLNLLCAAAALAVALRRNRGVGRGASLASVAGEDHAESVHDLVMHSPEDREDRYRRQRSS